MCTSESLWQPDALMAVACFDSDGTAMWQVVDEAECLASGYTWIDFGCNEIMVRS